VNRIFVQIPSYRDPELQSTLMDLFSKAENPERIRVAIYLQIIPEIDTGCRFHIPQSQQVHCTQVHAMESKGVCWARHHLQQLWDGEEYSLQIDSHMRFAPGWDNKLIGMLQRCGTDKNVLSTYPPHYTPPSTLYQDYITVIRPSHFDEWGTLLFESQYVHTDLAPGLPIAGLFCGACFLFGPSRVINEVPYDPNLYFFGEEVSLSARLWTHGWNIYHPNDTLVYHCWSRDYRPTHWRDVEHAEDLDRASRQRVNDLLVSGRPEDSAIIEPETYGLGTNRSLADFEKASGVNFSQRIISRPENTVQDPTRNEDPLEPFHW
jgi:hypothetical protein